jgi:hypothetical protein
VPLLTLTIEQVSKMPANPDEITIAEAYGAMSDFVVNNIESIERRVGESSLTAIRSLFEQSPSQIVESIRTYFLVPFQRLLVGFNTDTLVVPKSYELPRDTHADVQKLFRDHFAYMMNLKKYVKGYTAVKLTEARRQLSVILPIIQNEIRGTLVPGGAQAIPYLVGALIIGVLAEFTNPNQIPQGVSGQGGSFEPTARVPLTIVEVCLSRLNVEGLNFSEQQIRDLISRRIEAEKVTFINRLDRMSPEEKKVELMKKRLGLGEWAVGGTKAIYSLDPDQYERERLQRLEMGMGDFTLNPDALERANRLLQNEDLGGEGGYDNAQMAADDY